MKSGEPVHKIIYPENHICSGCDFIIPVEWLICENCGRVQSKMDYQDLKYYRHKRDKRQSTGIKDKKKKTRV